MNVSNLMMLLMPVIDISDSNSGLWCSITSFEGSMDMVWLEVLLQGLICLDRAVDPITKDTEQDIINSHVWR